MAGRGPMAIKQAKANKQRGEYAQESAMLESCTTWFKASQSKYMNNSGLEYHKLYQAMILRRKEGILC